MHRVWRYNTLTKSRICAGLGIAFLALTLQAMLSISSGLTQNYLSHVAPAATQMGSRLPIYLPIILTTGGVQPADGPLSNGVGDIAAGWGTATGPAEPGQSSLLPGQLPIDLHSRFDNSR
jgi:hypothetical protein